MAKPLPWSPLSWDIPTKGYDAKQIENFFFKGYGFAVAEPAFSDLATASHSQEPLEPER